MNFLKIAARWSNLSKKGNHEHSRSMMKFPIFTMCTIVAIILGVSSVCPWQRMVVKWYLPPSSLLSTNALHWNLDYNLMSSTRTGILWRCDSNDVSNEIKSNFKENSKNKSAFAYVCVWLNIETLNTRKIFFPVCLSLFHWFSCGTDRNVTRNDPIKEFSECSLHENAFEKEEGNRCLARNIFAKRARSGKWLTRFPAVPLCIGPHSPITLSYIGLSLCLTREML